MGTSLVLSFSQSSVVRAVRVAYWRKAKQSPVTGIGSRRLGFSPTRSRAMFERFPMGWVTPGGPGFARSVFLGGPLQRRPCRPRVQARPPAARVAVATVIAFLFTRSVVEILSGPWVLRGKFKKPKQPWLFVLENEENSPQSRCPLRL